MKRCAAALLTLLTVAGCAATTPTTGTRASPSPAQSGTTQRQFGDPRPGEPPATATHGYTISSITYPGYQSPVSIAQLAGGNAAVTARFNAAMRAAHADMPQQDSETNVDGSGVVTRIGTGVVAGRIELFWYGRGAAHPNRSLATVVISTATAQPITVDDLYLDTSAALARLRAIVPGLDPSGRVRTETLAYESFADWLPTDTGIEVYVSVAHALGDFIPVLVPWERIADLLRPGILEQLRAQ